MKTVLSGVAPSGNLHIGNYIGTFRQWIEEQKEYRCFFCVVDLHAITVAQNPETLRAKTREICALYLAIGIDPEKAHIFVQSQNPDHPHFAWILNCFIPFGALKRMTQFKDKSAQQKEFVSAGLFNYPTLMAADILLYQTDLVPVGQDQKQHLELARDVAERINAQYGPLLVIPEAKIEKKGARIMSLQNPISKMSKSDKNLDGSLFLLDHPDDTRRKIMSAVTDSLTDIRYDEKRPGISNLLTIYSFLGTILCEELETKYQGQGYKKFKEDLSEIVIEFLHPIREKYEELSKNPDYLDTILKKGLSHARNVSSKTLKRVSDAVGLGI